MTVLRSNGTLYLHVLWYQFHSCVNKSLVQIHNKGQSAGLKKSLLILLSQNFSFLKIKGTGNKFIKDSGAEKSAVWLFGTSRFSFWASNFSFPLSQMGKRSGTCLQTKSLKEQTKTCPGQVKFERYLSQGQSERFFF